MTDQMSVVTWPRSVIAVCEANTEGPLVHEAYANHVVGANLAVRPQFKVIAKGEYEIRPYT